MPKHIVIDARNRRSSTGRYADRLVEHLQNIDHENTYTILVQPDDPWEMHSPAFRTVPCPYPQFSVNPVHQLGFAWQVYSLKPDLVHFTMTQQPLLYFGNIVTTTHDLTMFYFVRRGTTPLPVYWLKMRLYHFLMWWSHKKSKKIIVPTQTVAKEVTDFQPFTKTKLVVTLEAAEPPNDRPAIQPAGIDGNFIMYLGNAFPHKNIEALVEAFDILHAQRPDLQLVLVGKKEKHYEELEANLVNHTSKNAVHITGFLPDEEAKWLYQHCQAYVFPSLMEGFGLPPLEAMTNGAAVVASRESCIPEVCGNAAYYFDPHSPVDMADKISEVLDNHALREKLRTAGAEQIKKYSWDKMAQETLAIYRATLGG